MVHIRVEDPRTHPHIASNHRTDAEASSSMRIVAEAAYEMAAAYRTLSVATMLYGLVV
jgi:hypothetical protein